MTQLYSQLQRTADLTPKRIMIFMPGHSISYGEIRRRVDDMIEGFTVIRNDRLMVLDEETPDQFIISMIAALESGYRVLPIPPSMKNSNKTKIYKAITEAKLSAPKRGEILHFTSGSTGIQKVIVRSLSNLENEAAGVAERLCLNHGNKCGILVTTPLAHSFGCGLWRAALIAGTTLYVANGDHIMGRLANVRKFYDHANIKAMFGVPYLYKLLLREALPTRHGNIRCFAGGEALDSSLALTWLSHANRPLKQEYGLGEGGIVTLAEESSTSQSLGVPLPSVRLETIATDIEGVRELVVHRPFAPNSYLFGESPETFRPDGGIVTGDLVTEIQGEYVFAGRTKSIIVVAGLKVVPGEIEDEIRKITQADEVVVVGVPDKMTGERPHAFIGAPYNNINISHLQAMLRKEFESYKVPKWYSIYKELPRTATGKIDIQYLKGTLQHES